MRRAAIVTLLMFSTVACATVPAGDGLSLLRQAADAGTARILIENLSSTDAAAVDARIVCGESPAVQDMWFDAVRLLNLHDAMRSYAQCAKGADVELIEATRLPLTPMRRQRIERYIAERERVQSSGAVDEVFGSLASNGAADAYTSAVLLALEADGSSEALVLCERLAAKLGTRCRGDVFAAGVRSFDTAEAAIGNDPFLVRFTPRLIAKSRDGLRQFYILETPKRPGGEMCRPIAVLASNAGRWSLERVECESMSNLAAEK